MNDKLKRLAHRLLEYFPEGEENVQDVYYKLTNIAQQQKEYFNYLGTSAFIKLTIYIYCYLNFHDMKLADKMIDRLLFANIFIHENDTYYETCDECGGDGYNTCSECNGTGTVSCSNCDGDGKMECQSCDGDGVDDEGDTCDECNGREEVDCDVCDGSGDDTCDECYGNGSENCSECDGDGNIETENTIYSYLTICTWNSNLKNKLISSEGSITPALSEKELSRLSNEFIKLFFEDKNIQFISEVLDEPDEVFCIKTSDEPTLQFGPNMRIEWNKDRGDMSPFI